jgi:ketosteroid isomerase-like protein
MSQENVEVVRRAWETVNSDDLDVDDLLEGYLDVWLDEFFDPEIEWHDLPTLPEAGVHRGRDAFRRHLADYLDAWADSTFEIEDIRAVGDRVVVRGRYGGVGRQSGAEIAGGLRGPATGAVYDFRAGRILRVLQFDTHAEALEAVGLSEQDAHADS